ncbi:MAG: hypothetical protein R6X02_22140 [Enhygromyxa sp.]
MLGALLTSLLASAPAPEKQPSIAGGWLQLTPAALAIPSPGGSDLARLHRAVRWGYRWGFAAGVSFEPVPRLFINVAAGFDQTVWVFRNVEPRGYLLCFGGDCYGWDERGLGHVIRIGPKLRLGWTSDRVVVWAMGTVELGISRLRLDCNNSVEAHCDRTETDLGPGVGGGLGFAIRATPHVAVGLEGSVDHVWLEPRDDPFRAVRTIDLALILALTF